MIWVLLFGGWQRRYKMPTKSEAQGAKTAPVLSKKEAPPVLSHVLSPMVHLYANTVDG